VDGEIFIISRTKELMKYGGQTFILIEIERAVAGACELPADAVAVVPKFDEVSGRESVVVFIEAANIADGERLSAAVRQAILAAFQIVAKDVVLLPRGGIPRTTSGKVKRALLHSTYPSDQSGAERNTERAAMTREKCTGADINQSAVCGSRADD
jgi:acyl-CoA synthetase (AMP-forming)/AMP-acid ligase II